MHFMPPHTHIWFTWLIGGDEMMTREYVKVIVDKLNVWFYELLNFNALKLFSSKHCYDDNDDSNWWMT
jgi:hypothetical protein